MVKFGNNAANLETLFKKKRQKSFFWKIVSKFASLLPNLAIFQNFIFLKQKNKILCRAVIYEKNLFSRVRWPYFGILRPKMAKIGEATRKNFSNFLKNFENFRRIFSPEGRKSAYCGRFSAIQEIHEFFASRACKITVLFVFYFYYFWFSIFPPFPPHFFLFLRFIFIYNIKMAQQSRDLAWWARPSDRLTSRNFRRFFG